MKNLQGLLLVDKASGFSSFHIVSLLRKITKERTIGHAGTLDPFATGVMVMLIGREFTRHSNNLLTADKQYKATLMLGISTDTYDLDGKVIKTSEKVPTLHEVTRVLSEFQGEILQIPPMFSAKKINGNKLYELARQGISIHREPIKVTIRIECLEYSYPCLKILVDSSKGTYIRSLANDIGNQLGCGAHLSSLVRLKSGCFRIEDSVPQQELSNPEFNITPHLRSL